LDAEEGANRHSTHSNSSLSDYLSSQLSEFNSIKSKRVWISVAVLCDADQGSLQRAMKSCFACDWIEWVSKIPSNLAQNATQSTIPVYSQGTRGTFVRSPEISRMRPGHCNRRSPCVSGHRAHRVGRQHYYMERA
jgi:hypothetical protein